MLCKLFLFSTKKISLYPSNVNVNFYRTMERYILHYFFITLKIRIFSCTLSVLIFSTLQRDSNFRIDTYFLHISLHLLTSCLHVWFTGAVPVHSTHRLFVLATPDRTSPPWWRGRRGTSRGAHHRGSRGYGHQERSHTLLDPGEAAVSVLSEISGRFRCGD